MQIWEHESFFFYRDLSFQLSYSHCEQIKNGDQVYLPWFRPASCPHEKHTFELF